MVLVHRVLLCLKKYSFLVNGLFNPFQTCQLWNYIIEALEISLTSSLCFPDRGACVHQGEPCRGACSGSHVAGDGEDHHQAHVWLPEELYFWWWLWMCAGGVCVGPPRPQSWAGTSVKQPSHRFSTRMHVFLSQGAVHQLMLILLCHSQTVSNRIGQNNSITWMIEWLFVNNPDVENAAMWK